MKLVHLNHDYYKLSISIDSIKDFNDSLINVFESAVSSYQLTNGKYSVLVKQKRSKTPIKFTATYSSGNIILYRS